MCPVAREKKKSRKRAGEISLVVAMEPTAAAATAAAATEECCRLQAAIIELVNAPLGEGEVDHKVSTPRGRGNG